MPIEKSITRTANPSGAESSIGQCKRQPWHRIIFEDRPFARSLIEKYLWLIVLGYPALIVLANSLRWSWLQPWLQFCTPLVNILRDLLPIFDNFESALVGVGFGSRVAAIHNLVAYAWVANAFVFIYLSSAILKTPRAYWIRLAATIPRHRLVIAFVSSMVCLPVGFYWIVFGFGLVNEDPFFSWYRFDLPMLSIGMMFVGTSGFGTIAEISFGGLLGTCWLRQLQKTQNDNYPVSR